ncbi:uncharacterized protein L201_007629 [Kwoniella dendrophila CBS 6074]|uniref:Uncharacterized protein n=1 Tax=Kwoniella dendrophila CBS 6074 TaxID=1295534 RepID=A0AAX4K770_9TREE
MPIGRSPIPPPERSMKLSSIGRMTSSPPPSNVTAEELIEAFRDLNASSPDSHVFTPGEIHEIIMALRTLQKREGGNRKLASEQLHFLFRELEDIIGNKSKSIKGLELTILSLTSRTERKVKTKDIIDAERRFMNIYRQPPSNNNVVDEKELSRYKASLNHLMYLCALAKEENRFEHWFSKFKRENLVEDSYTFLNQFILLEKINKLNELPNLLKKAFETEMNQEDKGVLINFTIHSFARQGKFNIAIKAYSKLLKLDYNDEKTLLDSFPPNEQSSEYNYRYQEERDDDVNLEIPIPETSKVTKELFGPLLSITVNSGNLIGSLIIFKNIFEYNFIPSIKDYISLFKGFSIYGQSDSPSENGSGSGECLRIFGLNEFQIHHSKSSLSFKQMIKNEERENFDNIFTNIWESGYGYFSEYENGNDNNYSHRNRNNYNFKAPKTIIKNDDSDKIENEWNLNTLQEIYLSFLTIQPNKLNEKGINKKQLWIILKAFVKTSNGDLQILEKVWNELQEKFGIENNKENWLPYKNDNRLIWAKRTLFGDDA